MAAAAKQASTLLFTQIGMGTVRTWPPLPTRSAITQCSSRCWIDSTRRPNNSARRRPHPINIGPSRDPASRARSRARGLKKPPALLGGQPVPQAHADPSHSLHASNAGCQLQDSGGRRRRLVRDPPDGASRRIESWQAHIALFEVNAVPEHDVRLNASGAPSSTRRRTRESRGRRFADR